MRAMTGTGDWLRIQIHPFVWGAGGAVRGTLVRLEPLCKNGWRYQQMVKVLSDDEEDRCNERQLKVLLHRCGSGADNKEDANQAMGKWPRSRQRRP